MATHEQVIRIPVGDCHIAGTLITPLTLTPGVLFVHGWGGSQEQYVARARQIAAMGCVCMTFDLSGHADTQPRRDTVSREANLSDLIGAYDMLASQPGVDRSAIAVVGSSYGGYLAAILTTLRPVKWLALRVPALYTDDGWELPKLQLHRDYDLVSYRKRFVVAGENRALKACSEFRGDVLLIESEFDELIPHPVIESYLEACARCKSSTYRVIQGADHGLSTEEHQQAYSSLLVHWMKEMTSGARRAQAITPVTPVTPSSPPGTAPEAPPKPA